MAIQPGDSELNFYSFKPNRPIRPQVPCYLTRTNERTHEIIKANLDKSPMFQGLIKGVGPRYCPIYIKWSFERSVLPLFFGIYQWADTHLFCQF